MRTKLFALMMLFGVAFVACEEETEEVCEAADAECTDGTSIDATACCTDEDCYWTYDYTEYACDGDDCSSALITIIDAACPDEEGEASTSMKSSTQTKAQLIEELQAVTERLMSEARACSGC